MKINFCFVLRNLICHVLYLAIASCIHISFFLSLEPVAKNDRVKAERKEKVNKKLNRIFCCYIFSSVGQYIQESSEKLALSYRTILWLVQGKKKTEDNV